MQNTPDAANDTVRVHTKRNRVQSPRVAFFATYDLRTCSPINKIKQNHRKETESVKVLKREVLLRLRRALMPDTYFLYAARTSA
jgi:hypothetical protein